ncbi:MAG TPA: alpha/beta hydrolase [Bdellovibrio sp.]|uniref:alpha/beta hydrolase n=1 Tax=Bdellovibrio sp. TaxID=28201 RepID=UPI002F0ADFA0
MSYTKSEIKEKMTSKMREIIETFEEFGTPPLESVGPQAARELPTMTDAVFGVMSRHITKKMGGPIMPVGKVDHKVIPGGDGEILLRIYSPKGIGPFPVIVYFHGGGWVIANLDTYDSSCRALTDAAGMIVVSVAYREAPEHKYPLPQEDAYAAYKWIVEHTDSINGLRSEITIAGESAGGNLATTVCLRARDDRFQLPLHQLLIYPVTDLNSKRGSHQEYANAMPLNQAMLDWFKKYYLSDVEAESALPLVSPMNAVLAGLPPTTIINAELDPLCTDGEEYAMKLKEAGVEVEQMTYPGVTHEFFGMAALLPESREAISYAVERIKQFIDFFDETEISPNDSSSSNKGHLDKWQGMA